MNDRFLRACRRQPTDKTPVWFMRQAGRYMSEYRALREKHSLLTLCRTPELAVEVTLQPVRALGVDAAILFSDLLLPLEPLGIPFDFAAGEGPVIGKPVRTAADVLALRRFDPRQELGMVLEAIRLLRRELRVPLIGFAGAPFTLASYAIEGGHSSHYALTRSLMYREPATWHRFASLLAETVRDYLVAQVEAGVEAVQVFDSWVGALAEEDYREYVLPHVRTIFDGLRETGVPTIHFGTGTLHLLAAQREAGGDVIGLDWRTPLEEGWARVGTGVAIQGNLDPTLLFAPRDILLARVDDVLRRAAGRPGHVFNLGHGILPGTPEDNVKAVVDHVHAPHHCIMSPLPPNMTAHPVAIVGGGVAGLAAAHALHERGLAFLLLESASALGGVIRTERAGGYLLEGGPDSLLAQKPEGLALVRALGLEDHIVPTNPTQRKVYVLHRGRLHPLPEGMMLTVPTRMGPVLRSSLFSLTGKLRMGLDLVLPARRGTEDESIASFVRRRFGGEALARLAEPLLAGIHAGDPEALSLRATFPRLAALEHEHGSVVRGLRASEAPSPSPAPAFLSLRGGMSEVVAGIVARVPAASLQTGARVETVQRSGSGFVLRSSRGEKVAARAVVVALPPLAAAPLLAPLAAPAAAILASLRAASTAVVVLGYPREQVAHPLDGYGLLVPRTEGLRSTAAGFHSTKLPGRVPEGRVMLRVFLGGIKDASVLELPDEALSALARQELGPVLGLRGEPELTRVFRWPSATPQMEVGHGAKVAAIERAILGVPGLFLTGSGLRGTGIPDTIADAHRAAAAAAAFVATGP